jgi:SOS-response transcriptional repressor LexA
MLTQRQRQVLDFLIDFTRANRGVSPSYDEVAAHLGFKSKSNTHRVLGDLEKRGFIRRLPNRVRAVEVLRTPDGSPTPHKGSELRAARELVFRMSGYINAHNPTPEGERLVEEARRYLRSNAVDLPE